MKFKVILFLSLTIGGFSFPQDNANKENLFTGNLKLDSKISNQLIPAQNAALNLFPENNKKSPFLAGLFSLILPGSGELYAKSYLKAGIFVAVEAALISVGLIYDKKGDNQTETFQKYADENWSVVKYAEWLNLHELSPEEQIPINANESLPPWQRVNWSILNSREVGSHKLPNYGQQQYYELIGKYHEYASGWNDFDINRIDVDALSPNFRFYSGMRGDANDLYNVASKAVIGIYINHFLSALDAAWTTTIYNKEIAMQLRVKPLNLTDHTEYIPTINFKIEM